MRPISGMPFVSVLPKGGSVRTRDVPKASSPAGSSVWGQDLTLDDWGSGQWLDFIRLQYVVGREHLVLDARRKPWGKPMAKTRDGLRTLEVGYDDLRGGAVEVRYIIEIGPKKFVELLLQCRKDGVARYAPYFARIRDSLRPTKTASK